MTIQQTATQAEETRDRADRAILKELVRRNGDLVQQAIKHVIAERAMAGDLRSLASFTRLNQELFPETVVRKATAVPATNGAAQTTKPADPTASAKPAKGRKAEQLELPAAEDDDEVEEEEIDEEEEEEPAEASDDEDDEETPPPAIKPARVGKMKKSGKGKRG